MNIIMRLKPIGIHCGVIVTQLPTEFPTLKRDDMNVEGMRYLAHYANAKMLQVHVKQELCTILSETFDGRVLLEQSSRRILHRGRYINQPDLGAMHLWVRDNGDLYCLTQNTELLELAQDASFRASVQSICSRRLNRMYKESIIITRFVFCRVTFQKGQ